MKVFSGVQPTGEIHIGNYLGAVKQWIQLQEKHKCIFCVVDLHSLTVPYPVRELQKRIREKAVAYLAAGVDPKKSIIFVQSKIAEHSELCWLLNTITPLGDLQRMTQFKEKAKKQAEHINAGLLNYPILMAADILLYDSELVPVGIDQVQHVELAREIARRFNNRFGKTFSLPRAMVSKSGAKIMSLVEPNKKMSKSDKPESYISLFDSPDLIKKKIMSAVTDSGREIKSSPNKPGLSNLLTIYSLFADKPLKKLEKEFEGQGYAQFKKSLTQLLIKKLEVFRKKKQEMERRPEFLEKILADGASRAKELAERKMKEVKKNMGLCSTSRI